MIRKYKIYNKAARKYAKEAVLIEHNVVSFYLYMFMQLLGRILIFFNPTFDLANTKIGENITKYKNFYFYDNFDTATKGKHYKKALNAMFIRIGLLVGGTLLIGVIGLGLYLVGNLLGNILLKININIGVLFGMNGGDLMGYLLVLPAVIGLFIYIIRVFIYSAGVSYIINKNDEIDVIPAFIGSYKTYKKNGKKVLIANFFFTLLKIILYIGIPAILFVLSNNIGVAVVVLSLRLVAIVLLFFISLRQIARIICQYLTVKYLLNKDITYVPTVNYEGARGIKINRVNKEEIDQSIIQKELRGLFDDNDDRYHESEEMLSSLLSNRISLKRNKLQEVNKVPVTTIVNEQEIHEETVVDEPIQEDLTETKLPQELTRQQIRRLEKLERRKKREEKLEKKEKVVLPVRHKKHGESALAENQEIDEEITKTLDSLSEFDQYESPITEQDKKAEDEVISEESQENIENVSQDSQEDVAEVSEESQESVAEVSETSQESPADVPVESQESISEVSEETKEEPKTLEEEHIFSELTEAADKEVNPEDKDAERKAKIAERIAKAQAARKKNDLDRANKIKEKTKNESKEEN